MYEEIGKDLSGKEPHSPKDGRPLWGLAIKALLEERKTRGEDASVQRLSKETGINPKHLLNVIAQRVKDPPGDKLFKIAEAFGISFPEFASRAILKHPASVSITGSADRASIDYGLHGFSIQALSPPGTSPRDFFVGIMTIKAFKTLSKWRFPGNLKVGLFVESGTLEFVYGEKTMRLPANTYLSFDASFPHRLKNIDSREAKAILITQPPLY